MSRLPSEDLVWPTASSSPRLAEEFDFVPEGEVRIAVLGVRAAEVVEGLAVRPGGMQMKFELLADGISDVSSELALLFMTDCKD